MSAGAVIAIAATLVLVAGPLAVAALEAVRHSRDGTAAAPPGGGWDWRIAATSVAFFTLAFNLTFLIQELGLVVPKAFTPGLHPVLYHNDHQWTGTHPLAELFQGTGAVAILLSAGVSAWVLARLPARAAGWRLFLVWMTYHGVFQALPQVVIATLNPRSDVGRAFAHLGLDASTTRVAAFAALALIPPVALALRRRFLDFVDDAAQLATARGRSRFIANVATVPALLAFPVIVLFRVPREWIEVLIVPCFAMIAGLGWIQAAAWRAPPIRAAGGPTRGVLAGAWIAVGLLLAVFQLGLRRGVPFG